MNDPLPDPLEEFLQRSFDRPADDRLRQSLLEQTSRVVQRRRLMRRLSFTVALAACFLVGVAVGGRLLATAEENPPVVRTPPRQKEAEASVLPPAPTTAWAHEWQAFDAQRDRAEMYFEAGRKYLRENLDYESALRCYRRGLDLASEETLAVSANDDWLLITLKQARRKENQHAGLN